MSMATQGEDDRIARYESYAAADPDNALIWITLGDHCHTAGRLEEATAAFERALVCEPDNPVARGRLAAVEISRGAFGRAEHLLRVLIEDGLDDPALRHNLGLALMYQQRFEEALEVLQAIDTDAQPVTLGYLARAWHQLGDTEKAIAFARAHVEAEPSVETQGYLALLEFDHGADLETARARASAVLERDPENVDASVVIGTWLAEQQDMGRSEPLFRRITERDPQNPRGWLGLGIALFYANDMSGAIRALERASALAPDNVGIRTTIGWARFLSRDLEGADEAFRAAIRCDRNFGEAHGGLAVVEAAMGRTDDARRSIRRARGLDAGNFGGPFAESLLLELGGDHDSATERLAGLLERRPREDAPTLLEMIQTFAQHQQALAEGLPTLPEGAAPAAAREESAVSEDLDPEELVALAIKRLQSDNGAGGLELLERAIRADPGFGPAYHLRASLRASEQRFDLAIADMKRAVELEADPSSARFELGMMLISHGRIPEAQEAWAPLVELGETHPLFLFQRGMLHLVRDEFDDCIADLERGISLNQTNPALSKEMVKIVEKVRTTAQR